MSIVTSAKGLVAVDECLALGDTVRQHPRLERGVGILVAGAFRDGEPSRRGIVRRRPCQPLAIRHSPAGAPGRRDATCRPQCSPGSRAGTTPSPALHVRLPLARRLRERNSRPARRWPRRFAARTLTEHDQGEGCVDQPQRVHRNGSGPPRGQRRWLQPPRGQEAQGEEAQGQEGQEAPKRASTASEPAAASAPPELPASSPHNGRHHLFGPVMPLRFVYDRRGLGPRIHRGVE